MRRQDDDGGAAESGLASIEALVASGDTDTTRTALELFGPGLGRVANEDQALRLAELAAAVGADLDWLSAPAPAMRR